MGTLLEGLFFGPTEWLLIFIVVLLLFGGKKIPEVMKGLGSGIRSFKDAVKDDEESPKPGSSSEKAKPDIISEDSEPKSPSGN
jgi:sec-independent protein translocase protein TatA